MDEYIGMITAFAGNFVPQGYFECDGRTLDIRQYTALYSLIGTTYGGDVTKNIFKVPDLRSRSIIGTGALPSQIAKRPGQSGGEEKVLLTQNNLPPHNHPYNALTGARESKEPANNYIGTAGGLFYAKKDASDTLIQMNAKMIAGAPGASLPHNNMAPFLCITYAICWDGIYPPNPN